MSVNASNPTDGSLCVRLPWDSEHFGFEVGRVLPQQLSSAQVSEAIQWASSTGVRCLYWLAGSNGAETIAAERSGFVLADVRVTLRLDLKLPTHPDAGSGSLVRDVETLDLLPLMRLAAVSHRNTRFYSDPGFPSEGSDALYSRWIEKSFHDQRTKVIVSGESGFPTGYITCEPGPDPTTGTIGLMAVAASRRGLGLGSTMSAAALRLFADRGKTTVMVTTQGNNLPALRTYQRQGFRVSDIGFWFHLWSAPAAASTQL